MNLNKGNFQFTLIMFLLLISLQSFSAYADTVIYQQDLNGYSGTTDTYINIYSSNTNFWENTLLITRAYRNSKSLIRFDVTQIPSNAVINSAKLKLYVYNNSGNGGGNSVSLYRVLDKSWMESEATWNVYQSGFSWSAAGMGSGSDYSSSPDASPVVGYSPTNIWANFSITSLMQNWINGSYQNNGMVIITTNGPLMNIYSSESPNVTLRPKLIVNYTENSLDINPPVRSNGEPKRTLRAGTSQITLSLNTNKNSICRYSANPGLNYSEQNSFLITGGTNHHHNISGLANGTSYTYYVRCKDINNNENSDDYPISFSVASSNHTFIFGAAGDHGQKPSTNTTLSAIAVSPADFYLALGDMSYGANGTEQSWCDMVKSRIGNDFPFQLLAGNHEDDMGGNGFIGNFASCLPNKMNSVGIYPTEYYFDYRGVARIILISPNLRVNGESYNYISNNSHYQWLVNAIDGARASNLSWVIVGTHKVCITMGEKTCEMGEELLNLLVSKKVDLVLQGHDHTYQRSKQLSLSDSCINITPGTYNSNCVSGSGNVYDKGNGTVIVIAGAFGQSFYTSNPQDSEAGYFDKWMEGPSQTFGYVIYNVTDNKILAEYVGTSGNSQGMGGNFTDSFTISS